MTTYPLTRAALFALERAEADLCRLIADHAGRAELDAQNAAIAAAERAFAEAYALDMAGLADPDTARHTALTDRQWVRRMLRGAAA